MSKRLTKTIWYGSDVDSNGNPILPSTHGGLDGLNYGELFLHLSNGKATLWTLSSDGKIVEITGGGSEVDMSSYLLKSIWDKVFEIRTDSQGIEYIFGKLPMVTQYGITMYSGDGVDIPSLASGLPFDGRTIWYNPDTQQIEVIGGTGGGSGEGVSNFWDLSGIPSWITNSKPKYSYSEIEGTPDLSVYAQVDTLKAYVTLAGAQTLTGEKNFTGGLKVNGSPIIYDSANKYWKLQGNLVLTGGITMYADDGTLNLPSIYDGLPIDGTTIYWDTDAAGNRVIKAVIGGGTADSVAWVNITGKPTWIGSSKPVYSYSEIQGTPDLSVYALKTQIPSLSGYATESWVTKQNYATKATTLSGYGITDAYTKTNVDDLLKAYVTLSGEQTISGKKNFTTGGLFVNGSQIKYDATKKYWKLEGDLLVTGGVTMYGSDSSFTPSTIMDAIAVDGTTISKSGGVLKVIGGTGGGVADSVAWANITGKPTWIGSSKPSYSYSEISGAISTTELQNYLTSNSYLNVTSGDNRYLKLSGGTIKNGSTRNPLIIDTDNSIGSYLAFKTSNVNKAYVGFDSSLGALLQDAATNTAFNIQSLNAYIGNGNVKYKVFHEGNDGHGSGLDADLLDGKHNGDLTAQYFSRGKILTKADTINKLMSGVYCYINGDNPTGSVDDNVILLAFRNESRNDMFQLAGAANTVNLYYRRAANVGNSYENWTNWEKIAFTSSNVASATKLATARTIWGQSFDGTENIDGKLLINTSISGDVLSFNDTRTTQGVLTIRFDRNDVDYGGINWFHDGYNNYAYNSTSHINIGHSTGFVSLGLWTSPLLIADIDKKCVGINTTTPAFALDINGSVHSTYIKTGDAPPIAFPNYINSSSLIYQQWHTFVGYNGKGFIFGQDNTDSSIARLSIYGGDTTMSYLRIENAVEVSNNSENGSAVLRMCMNQTGAKDQNPNIEFMKGTAYIDWHYAGDTSVDYTTRLIESSKGVLTLKGGFVIDNTLSVGDDAEFKKRAFIKNYVTFSDLDAPGGSNSSTARIGTFDHNEGGIVIQLGKSGTGSNPTKQRFEIINPAWNVSLMWVDRNGNMLVNGGVTMYSDQRKKTILNHVELSLKQIAEAPLIEHYYNGDEQRTTHVGSIAQYWASMNDWFCKLDSEGYYTMEIQNAALASAISIARELDRYESKTDKAIKKLKKRICELEEEVERLKSA